MPAKRAARSATPTPQTGPLFVAAFGSGAERRAALAQVTAAPDALDGAAALYRETGHPAVLALAVELLARRPDWLDDAAAWVEEAALDQWAALALASDLAWAARRRGRSPLIALREMPLERLDAGSAEQRFRLYCLLQCERFDFRFAALLEAVHRLGSAWTADPFVLACRSFAGFATGAYESALSDLEAARAAAPTQPKVLHVLVHGLWFADAYDRRADLVLDLVQQLLIHSPGDAIVHLRRGVALRWQGAHEASLRAFDDGIALLAPEAVEIHADFVRERTLTSAAWESERAYRRLVEGLRSEADREIESVRAQLSDGVFKVVEVLGIFLALAGFLAASGFALGPKGVGVGGRAVLLAVAAAGSVAFFVLLRFTVRPRAASAPR